MWSGHEPMHVRVPFCQVILAWPPLALKIECSATLVLASLRLAKLAWVPLALKRRWSCTSVLPSLRLAKLAWVPLALKRSCSGTRGVAGVMLVHLVSIPGALHLVIIHPENRGPHIQHSDLFQYTRA